MILEKLLGARFLRGDRVRRLAPRALKAVARKRLPYAVYQSAQRRRIAEKRLGESIPMVSDFDSPHDAVLGILWDHDYTFVFNIAACRDLRVRYKVLDIFADDWVDRIKGSGCDAFLTTPSTLLTVWRRMYEERLWVMTHDLKKMLCPSFSELYFWESKRRMRDWLVAHGVPHPESWVFLRRGEAMDFLRHADYPLVCKTDRGAASNGIFILKSRRQAERMVGKAFGKGILPRLTDARDREWGSILFQEYVSHAFEWRVVRIGDDFMCRRKVQVGAFASGSGDIHWAEPLPGMLDFVWEVTELGEFTSMAVDLFANDSVGSSERFLVNELQAVFGPIEREQELNEHAGRWKRGSETGRWSFEPGFFYRNACANLRVRWLLEGLVS